MNECAEKEGTMRPHRDPSIPHAIYTLKLKMSILWIHNLHFRIIFTQLVIALFCILIFSDAKLPPQSHKS